MFNRVVQFIMGRKAVPTTEPQFVLEVKVAEWKKPNRRTERIILAAWVLIAIKHVAVIWAVRHYPIPFHQLWINFPTWLLGTLATVLYFRRD